MTEGGKVVAKALCNPGKCFHDAERQHHILRSSLIPPHSRVRPHGRRPCQERAQPEISDHRLRRGPVGLGCTCPWDEVVIVERLHAVFEEDAERLGAEEADGAGLT